VSEYDYTNADPGIVEQLVNAAINNYCAEDTRNVANRLREQCRIQTVAEAEKELADVCTYHLGSLEVGRDIRGIDARAIRQASEAVREARKREKG